MVALPHHCGLLVPDHWACQGVFNLVVIFAVDIPLVQWLLTRLSHRGGGGGSGRCRDNGLAVGRGYGILQLRESSAPASPTHDAVNFKMVEVRRCRAWAGGRGYSRHA